MVPKAHSPLVSTVFCGWMCSLILLPCTGLEPWGLRLLGKYSQPPPPEWYGASISACGKRASP